MMNHQIDIKKLPSGSDSFKKVLKVTSDEGNVTKIKAKN